EAPDPVARFDGGATVRAQAGGRREGIQSAAAGTPEPSPPAGVCRRDGGLSGRDLASRKCAYGRWSDSLDPRSGRATSKGRGPGDHVAARQGLLLEGDGRGAGRARGPILSQGTGLEVGPRGAGPGSAL